jgi:flagellar assembly protein FliH
MISLSRIIKSSLANSDDNEKKTIKIRTFSQIFPDVDSSENPAFTDISTGRILDEANLNAEKIISEAKEEAELIRNQVELERKQWEETGRQQMYEEAREQGFSEGWNQGSQQGYQEMSEQIEYAKELIEASKADYRNHIESSEKTILELGIKVAERIIGSNLEASEESFLSIVKQAIKEARDYREIQIHVNPGHYPFILSQKEELLSIFPTETDIYIYPDSDLSESSCIIESSYGRIDAGVDSQLSQIKQKLIEILEGEN